MPGRPLWQVAGKRDKDQEREAQHWIETLLGEKFPAGIAYEDCLHDGIILCRLMNRLSPGIVPKINISGGDYKMMDNINQFQKACIKYGVADVDLFQTTDLWDKKNIALVTTTIFAVGRAVSVLMCCTTRTCGCVLVSKIIPKCLSEHVLLFVYVSNENHH